MSSEKFCLRWNDFESNISVAFRELRDDKDFFDVTLACEDEQMQAHKVILSACSPFFRNVLRRNPHQNPLLYLKGVRYSDLQAVLNFMYHGEVNVAQEELNSFLAVAEDLRVKGLTQNSQGGGSSSASERPKESFNSSSSHVSKPRPPPDRDPIVPPKRPRPTPTSSFPSHDDDDIQEVVPVKQEPREAPPAPAPVVAQPAQSYLPQQNLQQQPVEEHQGQLQQVDDSLQYQGDESYDDFGQYGADGGYVEQNMGQVEAGKGSFSTPEDFDVYIEKEYDHSGYFCTICSLFRKRGRNDVRNHIESKHYPGTFSYDCPDCGQTLNTKKALLRHQQRVHSGAFANTYIGN